MREIDESGGTQDGQINEQKSNKKHKTDLRSASAQILATLIQDWLLLGIGLTLGVPTLVVGALYRNPASTFTLDDDQASWIGSIPFICNIIGSLASGPFQEQFGRKGSMILVNIPFFCAWLLLFYARSVASLYAASAIMGLCAGFSEAPLHSYCGEIGEPHLRGMLSTMSTSAAIMGSLLIYVFAYFFEWRGAALISSAFPVITFISMTQIPESPTWLVMRGRLEDAQRSLCWLRGWVEPDQVRDEFEALVNYTKQKVASLETAHLNILERPAIEKCNVFTAHLKGLTAKNLLRPLRMECIVIANSYTTGFAGSKPYQIQIFRQLGYGDFAKRILILGHLIFFVGAMGNLILLPYFGKRKLALFAFGLSFSCLFGIGTFGIFRMELIQIPGLFWLPLILILVFKFTLGLSIMPLPWQLLCEVFPPIGRGTASGISSAFGNLISFGMTKSFLYLKAWLDLPGVIYLYVACAFLGWLYFYFYLPETEGKTLEQIESYFTENHDRKEKFFIGKSGRKN
nr:PREDICTED: facilitated trehalose transporter Tret1-like [Bemisia tabaci]XP_018911752.1 PREDICTED: facilitated trehalose transporter Tret1-like [Bemisia tabaci]XP_018911760.1 PREDICTED: facilitated trehalose transporter Tret1-like [Bemisia tabaci]